MKKFAFSLKSVLEYRREMLDAAKTEFAQAQAQVLRQEELLEEARQRYEQYCLELREKQAAGMKASDALMASTALTVSQREIEGLEKELQNLRNQAEEKRAAMVSAKQDYMTLDKMREQKLDAYHKALQKDAERATEEFVNTVRVMSTSER